jgi:hypothetical protein
VNIVAHWPQERGIFVMSMPENTTRTIGTARRTPASVRCLRTSAMRPLIALHPSLSRPIWVCLPRLQPAKRPVPLEVRVEANETDPVRSSGPIPRAQTVRP